MHVDALAVRLRPRTPTEAIDLGTALCQRSAPAVYRCYLVALVPVLVLAIAATEVIGMFATIVIWWSKPWLDRTILFVLSRAAFGRGHDDWRSVASAVARLVEAAAVHHHRTAIVALAFAHRTRVPARGWAGVRFR